MAHLAVFATGIVGMIAVCGWVTLSGCIHANATAADAWMFDAASLSAAMVLPWCSNLRWSDSIPSRFACLTSLWSYSLYLCHLAVFRVVWMAGRHSHFKGIGLIAVLAAYAVAAVVYYGFERPILRLRDRTPSRKPVSRGEFAVAL
jgi:peptidoglycan/LPS O-acetylase OafA/YrhL